MENVKSGMGELYEQCYYKEGKLKCEYMRWHENGQLLCHQYFENDKNEG